MVDIQLILYEKIIEIVKKHGYLLYKSELYEYEHGYVDHIHFTVVNEHDFKKDRHSDGKTYKYFNIHADVIYISQRFQKRVVACIADPDLFEIIHEALSY